MKRLFLIIFALVLLGGSAWGTVYYVDASRPDDTGAGTSWETAKKTIAAGKGLMNGDDTLNVANGTYAETANLTWPNGGNNIISGVSKTGVVVDLSAITGSWVQLSTSNDDNGTLENMTVKNLQASSKYVLQVSDADNFTVRNVKFKDNQRLINVVSGSTGFLMEYCESSGIRDTARGGVLNNGAVTINYSVFRASENYLHSTLQCYNVASTLTVNQSIFAGHNGIAIQALDEITATIKNTLFMGNGNNTEFGERHITGDAANFTLSACYSTDNWSYNMDTEIVSGFTVASPLLTKQTRFGIILLSVDDLNNWDYAKTFAAVANARGYHITFYIHSNSLTVGTDDADLPLAEAKAFLDAGNDFGCHSENHPNDITIDADNLPTSGLWDTEITAAKAKLEAYIQQITGYETWECIIWASPGNKGSTALADRIKTDGFEFGRMGGVNDGDSFLLSNNAVYTVKPIATRFFKEAQDSAVVSPDNIAQLCGHMAEAGLVGESYFHSDNATYDDPNATGLGEMFDELAKHNVLLMNAREYLTWLAANSVYSDAAGNAARWAYTFTSDNFNGHLKPTSPCINTGEWIDGVNNELPHTTLDIFGNTITGSPNIGADQELGSTVNGLSFYDSSVPETTMWNTFTELIAAKTLAGNDIIDGLNNTFYERWVIPTSGTSGNPIIFRNALIDGTVPFDGSWTFNPSNTYSETAAWVQVGATEVYTKSCTRSVWTLLEDNVKLTPILAAGLGSIARGEYGWNSDVLYYRASDGADPSTHSIRAADRSKDGLSGLLNIDTKNYLNFSNITLRHYNNNTADAFGIFAVSTGTLDFSDMTVYDCRKGASFGTTSNVTFDGIIRDNYQSGVMVEGNTTSIDLTGQFSRNGRQLFYTGTVLSYSGDGDGIGIGGDGGTMSGITIHDAEIIDNGEPDTETTGGGAGIYLGTGNTMTVGGVKIYNNTIRGNHDGAIYLGDEHTDSLVYSNVIDDNLNTSGSTRNAVQLDVRHTSFTSCKFVNNVVMNNNGNSALLRFGSNATVLKNNIFYQNGQTGTYRGDFWTTSLTGLTEDNNVYYRNGTAFDSATMIEAPSSTTYDKDHIIGASAGYWQNDSSQGANDLISDPLITLDGKLLPTSPCINTGSWEIGTNKESQSDLWGKYLYRLPNIGADQGAGTPTVGQKQINLTGPGIN
ncbi:MAG: hypothetical protein GY861_11545 [bacterium]|nr:hypothetical protein [bacterium]